MIRRPPLVIGHRGAPGYRPEHTRSSYELAFAMGADAVEPDVVPTRDGILVVRHENEISGTTDVANRPEYAGRRRSQRVDGKEEDGWFVEDFTWAELASLRCRERLPRLRERSASHDGEETILRLSDLLGMVRAASVERERRIGVVLEIKHATFFQARGFDLAAMVEREIHDAGWADGSLPLWIESFEASILDELHQREVAASLVYLVEATGQPFDLVAVRGHAAPSYADQVSAEGLAGLAARVQGISVDKAVLLRRPGLVPEAQSLGLSVFAWTCRPENAFLGRRHRGRGGPADFGDYRAEWRGIAETGLDGVFVDYPDLGAEVFRDEGSGAPKRPRVGAPA